MSARRFGAAGQVAVVGYALSPLARHADVSLGPLTVDTCLRAIADAGLRKEQIDGFTTASMLPSSGGAKNIDGVNIVTSNWLAEHLGIHPRWACGFQGHGQLPGSALLAAGAIASGAADYVLVHRALGNPAGARYHENPMKVAAGAAQWSAPQGFWGPAAPIAMPYNEYMRRYGATREEMATLVVEIRRNAARIPWAYWHDKPITVDDYMNARMIGDPISILDCDIPVDGVGAFVFTSAERAKDLPHRPVYVGGYGQGHPVAPTRHWTLDDIIERGAVTGRQLWESSGMRPEDVDLPQMYDGFSPLVYFWLESLGFCPVGEAHRFVQDGNIATETGLPIVSSGGALGNGRMHGVPQMLECYLQLSRRAGERQREKADVALACHAAPHLGGVMLYTAEPS